MDILIVGVNSFLGRALLNELEKNPKNHVVCVRRCHNQGINCAHSDPSWLCVKEDGSLLSQSELKFEKIYLLSTVYSKKIEDAQSIIRCNLDYLTQILFSQVNSELKHVIYSNSYMALPQILNSNSSLYAKSKDLFAQIAKELAIKHNFSFDNVYLFDILGPKDNRRKLLQLIAESHQNKKTLNMSEGHQLIAPLSVMDAARILSNLAISNGDSKNRDYLLHGIDIFTVREFVDLIERIYFQHFDIAWGALPSGTDQLYEMPTDIYNLADRQQENTIIETIKSILDSVLL